MSDMPPATTEPDRTVEIAGFTILESIGSGYSSNVYAGIHLQTGTKCAIKVLRKEVAKEPDLVARLEREAAILSSLDHPNICACIGHGRTRNGIPAIATKFMDGMNLSELLMQRGSLTEPEASRVGAAMVSALAYAHAKAGIIHRDVKPANILLADLGPGWTITPTTQIALTDFGLSKASGNTNQMGLTRAGDIMGTPAYLAPETAKEGTNEHASDLYSLGITLYQLIYGRVPFDGTSVVALLSAQIHERIPHLAATKPGTSKAFSNMVVRMMQKSPRKRPTNDAALEAEFWRLTDPAASFTSESSAPNAMTWIIVGGFAAGIGVIVLIAHFALR
jgi:serine/threonine-protein kinase